VRVEVFAHTKRYALKDQTRRQTPPLPHAELHGPATIGQFIRENVDGK
jgi:hypothetical protein